MRPGVTFAPKIDRESARIDWRRDAATVARQVRAFDPAPGAWTTPATPRSSSSARVPADERGEPGCVLAAGERLVVGCGDGALAVREVQPAGKTRLAVEDWVRGRGITPGARLAMRPLPRLHAVTDAAVLGAPDFGVRAAAIAAAGPAVALHARDRTAGGADARAATRAPARAGAAARGGGVRERPARHRRGAGRAGRAARRRRPLAGRRAPGVRRAGGSAGRCTTSRRRSGGRGRRRLSARGERVPRPPTATRAAGRRASSLVRADRGARPAGDRHRRDRRRRARARARDAGAYGVAAIRALWRATDPAAAALALLAPWAGDA